MTDTVYTDEDGMLFKYECSYIHDGNQYGFPLWAANQDEATAMLKSIGQNGIVNGKMIGAWPLRQGGEE